MKDSKSIYKFLWLMYNYFGVKHERVKYGMEDGYRFAMPLVRKMDAGTLTDEEIYTVSRIYKKYVHIIRVFKVTDPELDLKEFIEVNPTFRHALKNFNENKVHNKVNELWSNSEE